MTCRVTCRLVQETMDGRSNHPGLGQETTAGRITEGWSERDKYESLSPSRTFFSPTPFPHSYECTSVEELQLQETSKSYEQARLYLCLRPDLYGWPLPLKLPLMVVSDPDPGSTTRIPSGMLLDMELE